MFLGQLEYVVVQHSRIDDNKVAYFFVNLGCKYHDLDLDEIWLPSNLEFDIISL